MMNNTNSLMQDIKVGQIWVANKSGNERRVKAISGYDVITIRWHEDTGVIITSWGYEDFLLSHTLKEEK